MTTPRHARHACPRHACPRRRTTVLVLALAATLAGLAGCETPTMMREKGEAALRDGDYERARHHFHRAEERRPHDLRTQYYLGLSHLRLGEPRRAQSAFERALTLSRQEEPWRGRILDRLAEAMYERGQHERLIVLLEEAVDETDAVADHLRLGRWHARLGNTDEAGRAYTRAIELAGDDDHRPYLEAAKFYESAGHVDRAVAALRYAHWVAPSNQEVIDRLRRHGVIPGPAAGEQPR